jgi:hypothetical protein
MLERKELSSLETSLDSNSKQVITSFGNRGRLVCHTKVGVILPKKLGGLRELMVFPSVQVVNLHNYNLHTLLWLVFCTHFAEKSNDMYLG